MAEMALFREFKIVNYRAIVNPLTIRLDRGLTPIIGLNESGKTTILEAIFFFDHHSDSSNGGRHLENLNNLTRLESQLGYVEAELELEHQELTDAVAAAVKARSEELVEAGHPELSEDVGTRYKLAAAASLSNTIRLRRRTSDLLYEVDLPGLDDPDLNNYLCRELLKWTPWLRYFDDFRMRFPNTLSLNRDDESGEEWRSMIERVFQRSQAGASIYGLSALDDRVRQRTIARAVRHLNDTLIEHWRSFRLEASAALTLQMTFEAVGADGHPCLALRVVETDSEGDEHFFHIEDRSKGFYWFFNFVMNVEFNEKVIDDMTQQMVYLLDEPGSYLHAAAQLRLCSKLAELGADSAVIYTTHSPFLLDTDVVPVKAIRVAERDSQLGIRLRTLPELVSDGGPNALAIQPAIEALRIPITAFSFFGARALVVEGLSDFYAYRMFMARGELADVRVFPSTGAASVRFVTSILIAGDTDFRCLWDNDEAGRDAHAEALKHLGERLADRLHLLPFANGKRKRRLEDLFNQDDLSRIRRALGLVESTSFRRTVAELFYAADGVREPIVESCERTLFNFAEVAEGLAW